MPRANRKGRKHIDIPAALPHQKPVLDHEARFKMLRCGRRWGKTRLKFRAAVTGHGPTTDGVRKFQGISTGKKILWVVADYPQGRGIWEEEIKPRFSGAYRVKLNESEHSVLLPNKGHLEIRSAESIDGVRGRKYDGVLCDEAAFWEFLYAWRRVIRPTLTDTGGWAIIGSTTEIGSDFNSVIKEVEEGKREGWKAFRGRSRDNPKLSKEELDLLYAEYPPGGSDMMQELEAELLDAHGSLFLESYFKYVDQINSVAMWINGIRHPFVEILLVADLASSLKQTADYTAILVVGITAQRKVGVLDLVYDHWEGPQQIDELQKMIQLWKPARAKIEAVQYQATAVQHLAQRQIGKTVLTPCYPDKDKRSRAVPWAAAMARDDVWWSREARYKMADVIAQHKKFPNGKEGSRYVEDHDDIVDCGSLVGEELIPSGGAWVMRKMGG